LKIHELTDKYHRAVVIDSEVPLLKEYKYYNLGGYMEPMSDATLTKFLVDKNIAIYVKEI